MFLLPRKKWLTALFLSVIAVRVIYYWQSHGFSIERITNSFPNTYQLSRPTEKELETLRSVCQQPFTYLGKGSQAYAFESQDGKYVLKLLKCYHLKPIPWLEKIELPSIFGRYVKQHLNRRYQKTKLSLESYKIAHDLIPDECGLLFLQIVPSEHFSQPVTFTDRIGRTFTIDLANYGFMIQKKMDLIFPTIKRFYEEGKKEEAKKLMHSIIELIAVRSQKGVSDQDPDIHKNLGCIGTQAQFIDVGSFHRNERAKLKTTYTEDAKKITRKLKHFLEVTTPELVPALDEELIAMN